MNIEEILHDTVLCKQLLEKLEQSVERHGKEIKFMEVCGTHTVSIFQSGLRSLLPKGVKHISGPGCPVCVTHDSEVDAFLQLAAKENVIIATFGDLMRVPAPDGQSLKHAVAQGAKVQIVYSPLDALTLAEENPQSEVVFLGVGFETTAPAVAATILNAKMRQIANFSVFSCHKLVPPALVALLESCRQGDSHLDAFILPGHVALILGLEPFEFIAKEYNYPAVVAGFEPAEIIHSLLMIAEQKEKGEAKIENAYSRAVSPEGNARAKATLDKVFYTRDANWRGLGLIPNSGLAIRPEFAEFDAQLRHNITLNESVVLRGCRCGDVLSGRINPKDCPLFGKVCTPQNPTGPCMVSTEGSCAAWYNYGQIEEI